ncbi:Spy/CpxP family protein refolding chaperone [Dyella sp.]|uniref:Spy/CpxP family protein refolding chaperone n=1 Tax=Dyella sp. TaxID=1869338 RepID=UPI002ED547D0
MRKILPLSFLLTAALGASALAFANPQDDSAAPGPAAHGQWHGGHHGHHGPFMALKQLNLTDDQKAQVKQIVKQGFGQLKPQFAAVRQQRQAFEALTPDAAGYQQAAASLAQAEASLTQARVTQNATTRAQIYNILTSAQKSQLASLKAQHEQRVQQWKQQRAQQAAGASQSAQ